MCLETQTAILIPYRRRSMVKGVWGLAEANLEWMGAIGNMTHQSLLNKIDAKKIPGAVYMRIASADAAATADLLLTAAFDAADIPPVGF
jgi:hypothetical protein